MGWAEAAGVIAICILFGAMIWGIVTVELDRARCLRERLEERRKMLERSSDHLFTWKTTTTTIRPPPPTTSVEDKQQE